MSNRPRSDTVRHYARDDRAAPERTRVESAEGWKIPKALRDISRARRPDRYDAMFRRRVATVQIPAPVKYRGESFFVNPLGRTAVLQDNRA